jgi:hypothetical protein
MKKFRPKNREARAGGFGPAPMLVCLWTDVKGDGRQWPDARGNYTGLLSIAVTATLATATRGTDDAIAQGGPDAVSTKTE